jgi:hypothetical protein
MIKAKLPAKFGSNRPSGFGEEAWNVKSLQTTDDVRQVMAIVHLDLWSRWTKNHHGPLLSQLYFIYQHFMPKRSNMLWLAEISKIFFSETNELTEPKL